MKKLLFSLAILFASGIISANAQAGMISGNAFPGMELNCSIMNFNSVPVMVEEFQYNYTCNNGPDDPFHSYFTSEPCMGMCNLGPHQNGMFMNGPPEFTCKQMTQISCYAMTSP